MGAGDFLVSTPHGVVSLSRAGNGRFDAKSEKWENLPWEGPAVRMFGLDQFIAAYDSKRDCLWSFDDQVIRYDFKTGKAEQIKTACKPRFPYYDHAWYLTRESVCIPQADLVLSSQALKSKEGWSGLAAWDLTSQKYIVLDLPVYHGGKRVPFGGAVVHHAGLAFDAKLNVVLLHDMTQKTVWVLRLDRKTAKVADVE